MQLSGSTKRPCPSSVIQDDEAKRSRIGSFESIAQGNNQNDEVPLTVNELNQFFRPPYYEHGFRFQDNLEGQFNKHPSIGGSNTLLNPIESGNLVPENVFYQSSDQFNTVLDNNLFYDRVQNELLEEPYRSIESDMAIDDPLEYYQTSQPIVEGKTILLRQDHPVLTPPQANETELETPAEKATDEHMKICNNYDTCFGVIIATSNSCYVGDDNAREVSIRLKPVGGNILLHDENCDAHLGSLSNPKLASTLFRLPLRLDATLLISEVKETREKKKSQMKNHGAKEAAWESIIRIILHGLQSDKEVVSGVLSDAGIFLQHPSPTEVIPGTRYDNPHYLARPGVGMPKLDYFYHQRMDGNTEIQLNDESRKGRFMRIFETAEADGGCVSVTNMMALSPRLRSPLMSHQILALAMMQEKEYGFVEEPRFPSLWRKEVVQNTTLAYYRHTITRSLEPKPILSLGGILADDMGLGKTLSMLALICASLDNDFATKDESPDREHKGTLIIAPKSTVGNWVKQVEEHINERGIRMAVYHGSNRQGLTNQLGNFDIIITTYETVRTECAAKEEDGPLFSWKWLRVVLDEAHHIRNGASQTFRSVCNLVSLYRWCLTGTPIHNSLDDYGSLLSFIRVFPFISRANFHSWVVKPVEAKHPLGIDRLRVLIRATCLRRIKEKVLSSSETRLPPRLERVHEVHLHQDDQIIYDILKQTCAEKAAGIEKRSIEGSPAKSKDKNLLALINSLRLICDHGEQLLPEAVKELLEGAPGGSFNSGMTQLGLDSCSACGGEINNSTLSSDNQMPICIDCAASEEGSQSMNSPFDLDGKEIPVCRPSAKVQALLDNLKQEQVEARRDGQPRKSVVFSYWVKMLNLVGKALQKENFIFQRIDGQKTLDGRQAAMQEFNDSPSCTVLLASIGSSAEGVNLTAASIVHLLEPHWNPMVEAQAVDRVYRIGQTQEVTVIRYIVPKSIETYVQMVQQEKIQLVNSAVNADEVTEADLDTQRWKGLKDILK